jgi:hypothetical protein
MKIEIKQLLCCAAFCTVGTFAIAASSSGRWIGPVTESQATPHAGRAAGVAPVVMAANANCPSNCESRQNACLKEAKTDAIRDKCKTYLKGCLKSCNQAK